MPVFTPAELDYLESQLLGRLATVGRDGRPHVTPLGFSYDAEHERIVISGHNFARSKKFRDAQENPAVALLVDDLVSIEPWLPRGIEIRGDAEAHETGGAQTARRIGAGVPFSGSWMSIRPRRILTWGIDTGSYELSARNVS